MINGVVNKKVKVIKSVKEEGKIRVGAYCRVSSDSEEQSNSFLAQMKYYDDYIKSNENMVFVDIYADEGITGTSVQKRSEFKRMMKDCKFHKLDRVFVKSVTRFARNSLECIEAIREMKSYGVSVYFENDNIDTATMNSEMILYIKSAFAQSEATSASKRMRTSVHMKMEEGTYQNGSAPYGYRYQNGKLCVCKKEADNIKMIFNLFLSGMGRNRIVEYMNEREKGNTKWTVTGIKYILNNEKYIGDTIFGKYYTTDIMPFKEKENKGEADKYYYKNSHPPIISEEEFQLVRKMQEEKTEKYYKKGNMQGLLHGKIYCRHCGWMYREIWRRGKLYWRCSKKSYYKNQCSSPCYSDKTICNAFVYMFNKLITNKKILLDETLKQLEQLNNNNSKRAKEIKDIDQKLIDAKEQQQMFLQLYKKNILNNELYIEKNDKVQREIEQLQEKRKVLTKEGKGNAIIEEIKALKKCIEEKSRLSEFNIIVFNDIVKKIYIEETGEITFILKGDIEFSVELKEVEG